MSQIKHFVFSPEKRRNLLLLIISLLQHSVNACNISPAVLGWNQCPPPAPSSATINSSAPVPALPGLGRESSAGLCLLWAAPGGGGSQNSYTNSQSLSQNQHRTLVCWFWYSTGRLAWVVRNERCSTTRLPGGGEVNVFLFKWNWTQSYSSIVFQALLSPKSLGNPEWGPVPQFQVYFGGKEVMFFRGFTLAIWLLGSPHKAVPLVLEIWTDRFGEFSWNTPLRQLSSCLWDEEKDSCQDCCVQIVLYPCSFSVFFVFCVHKHG